MADLTAVPDIPDGAFWKMAALTIDRKVDPICSRPPESDSALRVSVFALAPIPLLVHLGSRLSDKVEADLYPRHRSPETWCWKDGPGEARYDMRRLVDGRSGGPVALLINLSGKNDPATIPVEVREGATIYELTLDNQDPTPLFLNTRGDLERFTDTYHRALATIRLAHPDTQPLHVFPAVPAPIAITLGRARLSKIDPPFLVYDRDNRAGGFVPALEIS